MCRHDLLPPDASSHLQRSTWTRSLGAQTCWNSWQGLSGPHPGHAESGEEGRLVHDRVGPFLYCRPPFQFSYVEYLFYSEESND